MAGVGIYKCLLTFITLEEVLFPGQNQFTDSDHGHYWHESLHI